MEKKKHHPKKYATDFRRNGERITGYVFSCCCDYTVFPKHFLSRRARDTFAAGHGK